MPTPTRHPPARRQFITAAAAAVLGAAARPVRAAAPSQLRIGFQKSAVNLVVLKQQGALERRFAGTPVQWVEFPAGPQLLEALAVGGVDFGLTGDTPPVFAQAAGKDLLYVGAEPAKPLSSAILVKADAPLATLADLKGRRVALQKGSSAHYLLVRELDIKPRVLSTGVGLSSNNSFYLASRGFTEKHPDALQALFDALTRADACVQGSRKEAAQLISDFSGLNLATVHLFLSRRPRSPVGPLNAAIIADQQRVADAFARIGLIPRPVKVAEIVWQPTRLARAG